MPGSQLACFLHRCGTRHRQQENVQSMDERVAVGGVEGVGVVEIGGTITR